MSALLHSRTLTSLLLGGGLLLAACTPAQGPQGDAGSQEPGGSAVVARVNGEDILQGDVDVPLSQALQMATLQGQDTSDETVHALILADVMDQLIATLLLRQDAVRAGVEVTDESVDEEYRTIEAEMGGAEVLAEELAAAGYTQERLREDIRDQILIRQHIEQHLALHGEQDVSDEELQATYDELSAEYEEMPPLEEIADLLRTEVSRQKEQDVVQALIAELRAEADIEILS